jgi:hypothetical protein
MRLTSQFEHAIKSCKKKSAPCKKNEANIYEPVQTFVKICTEFDGDVNTTIYYNKFVHMALVYEKEKDGESFSVNKYSIEEYEKINAGLLILNLNRFVFRDDKLMWVVPTRGSAKELDSVYKFCVFHGWELVWYHCRMQLRALKNKT